ncbi:WG repeat-containing protein [Psychrobacter alimentarius]|uniref:WG repeat-containing protein n=1 Tax=Psychrobacter alimentarius TaxID=261164 RepID=UPI001918E9EF|nr:WG repeat-containing protein [Psychrobacter alimentarius]
MFRRLLSKRQPSLILGLPRTLSHYGLTLSILSGALLMMPTAQAASCKIPKSYYKNVSCTANSGYFLAIKDFGAPVALLNNKGKSVVDLSRYQKVDANKLSGGLLPVQRNNRVGYLNMKGREVVPAMYDVLSESQGWARPVSDGRIVVKKDGNYGVINTANKTIVPFSAAISDIDDYQNGMARVRKNRAVSWLDKNGKTTSEPSNADGDEFAAKSSANKNSNASAQTKQAASNRFTTLDARQQDGKWGYVDDNNVTMITYSFDEARPFSEGLAGVRIGKDWGFINLGGELVIPFRFSNSGVSAKGSYKGQSAFIFKDGKAWIGNLKNGNKMCVDTKGEGVRCE